MIIASFLSPEARGHARHVASRCSSSSSCRWCLIALFWLVHILPEQIAHKRNHPQFEAIRTLCLLSLVFGGLLWPIAWLWAYSKPVLHKMAYGTDKLHPDEATGRARRLRPARSAGAPRGAGPAGGRARRRSAPTSTRSRPQRRGARSGVNGNHPSRHLLVLRLADLHQVQVAAVEHAVEGRRLRSSRSSPSRRCCCC